jgi:hypothetical protein
MLSLALVWLAPFPACPAQATAEAAAEPTPVATLCAEAERVEALVECKGTRAFLRATRALPEIGTRTVLYDAKTREAVTAEEHARLAPEEQARFLPTGYDGEFYYTTRYGTPSSTSATAASGTCGCSRASAATPSASRSTRSCACTTARPTRARSRA